MEKVKDILRFEDSRNRKVGLNKSSAGFFKSISFSIISHDENPLSGCFLLLFLLDALFPLIPYAFPAKLTLIPRSFETSSRELRRISETSEKVVYLCLILIRCIVKSIFYSKRNRWGEIPRFIGKSPPRIFVFSKCPDFPCM